MDWRVVCAGSGLVGIELRLGLQLYTTREDEKDTRLLCWRVVPQRHEKHGVNGVELPHRIRALCDTSNRPAQGMEVGRKWRKWVGQRTEMF